MDTPPKLPKKPTPTRTKHGDLINLRFEENRKRQGLILTLLSTNASSKKVVVNNTTAPGTATTQTDTLEHSRNVENKHDELKMEGENTFCTLSSSALTTTTTTPTTVPPTQSAISSAGLLDADKSRKGSVDEKILPLVNLINSTDDFFTTSTCSGRIILFANILNNVGCYVGEVGFLSALGHKWKEMEKVEGVGRPGESDASAKIKKQGCKWILVSHDLVKPEEFMSKWEEVNTGNEEDDDLSFKMEPAILHIQCRKLSDAKRLIHVGTESGFRNCGMVIGKENRITVAIRSAMGLEIPLSPQVPVTEEFLLHILKKANEKLTENWKRLEKLTVEFTKQYRL